MRTLIRLKRQLEKISMKIYRMDRISLPRRLTKEIYNEFNKINFILENLTSKLECLKEVEKKYNESISDEILLLIKNLKMLDSDYLRDKEEEEEI